MKVWELRHILEDISGDIDIVIQKDGEGNGYRLAHSLDFSGGLQPMSNWFDPKSGECITLEDMIEEDLSKSDYSTLCAVIY